MAEDESKGEHGGEDLNLVLDPPRGVGALEIGMALTKAGIVLAGMPGYRGIESGPLFATFESGMSIALEVDSAGEIKSIEVYRPIPGSATRVSYAGIRVFDEPATSVMRTLRRDNDLRFKTMDGMSLYPVACWPCGGRLFPSP